MNDELASERAAMVNTLRTHGIHDARVIAAMGRVRRHKFFPEEHRTHEAYGDYPCPIGYGQTISQPFIVAFMTELMHIRKGEKVLEIGTGSGYQAAVLAELGAVVYSVEILPELANHASNALTAHGYGLDMVHVLIGNGMCGWPEHSPYDVIVATCAPTEIPQPLIDQLADSGRMILPLGSWAQRLVIVRKNNGRIETEDSIAVRFVPMVGGE
ncbi:MAG: protein-L-isoaspartate(D-aspartate) O-methyltransferase [bacterium]